MFDQNFGKVIEGLKWCQNHYPKMFDWNCYEN